MGSELFLATSAHQYTAVEATPTLPVGRGFPMTKNSIPGLGHDSPGRESMGNRAPTSGGRPEPGGITQPGDNHCERRSTMAQSSYRSSAGGHCAAPLMY